jgi:TorA maturation chaperone TorD
VTIALGEAPRSELLAITSKEATRLLAYADLYTILAQAFLPPPPVLARQAWLDALAADLRDLDSELPALELASAAGDLDRFRAATPAAGDAWLVEYSRLFLMPPVPVTLNTGQYLEGSLAGHSAQMLRECYARAGYAPDESFRDLPDHVAMQLQFLQRLYERAAGGEQAMVDMAREFQAVFVRHWAPALYATCAAAVERFPAATAFRTLAGVIERLASD